MKVEITVRKSDYSEVVYDLYSKGTNFTAVPSPTNADEYIITFMDNLDDTPFIWMP